MDTAVPWIATHRFRGDDSERTTVPEANALGQTSQADQLFTKNRLRESWTGAEKLVKTGGQHFKAGVTSIGGQNRRLLAQSRMVTDSLGVLKCIHTLGEIYDERVDRIAERQVLGATRENGFFEFQPAHAGCIGYRANLLNRCGAIGFSRRI